MEWIFNNAWQYHIPEKMISGADYMYLWMTDDYEYYLAIEDDELRVYSYDYWSEDTIRSYHEWESWWGWLGERFEWMYDCFAIDTIRYIALNIEWEETSDITKSIVNWVYANMTGDANHYLIEGDDRRDRIPSEELTKFIKRALEKIGLRVYCYYK